MRNSKTESCTIDGTELSIEYTVDCVKISRNSKQIKLAGGDIELRILYSMISRLLSSIDKVC